MSIVEEQFSFIVLNNFELGEILNCAVPSVDTYEHVYFSPSHLNEIENDSEFNTERLIHGVVQKSNSQYYNFDDNLYGG